MSRANLSRREAMALGQMEVLAAGVAADPGRYGVPPAVAAELVAAVERFRGAYERGNPQAPRTRGDVAEKDEAFAVAEAAYRRVYSRIKWDEAVSDEHKLLVGVRPVNRSRVRVQAPAWAPVVNILGATPYVHTLTYHPSDDPEQRGKPAGAAQLQLFVAVGGKPVRDPAEARLRGCYTRNPVRVAYDAAEAGKVATYFARWVSPRGEVGGFSLPKSMVIAA